MRRSKAEQDALWIVWDLFLELPIGSEGSELMKSAFNYLLRRRN